MEARRCEKEARENERLVHVHEKREAKEREKQERMAKELEKEAEKVERRKEKEAQKAKDEETNNIHAGLKVQPRSRQKSTYARNLALEVDTTLHSHLSYNFVKSVSFIALTSNSCVQVLLGCVCKNQYVCARSLGCTR